MSAPHRYRLVGQTPVPCDDLLEWAQWYETAERRVRQTRIGPMEVSTVFLGLDHQWGNGPPLLFETMIFLAAIRDETGSAVPATLDFQTRCSTWLEAEQMHERAVAEYRERWDDVEELYPVPVEKAISPR